jgi:hypothetical protein
VLDAQDQPLASAALGIFALAASAARHTPTVAAQVGRALSFTQPTGNHARGLAYVCNQSRSRRKCSDLSCSRVLPIRSPSQIRTSSPYAEMRLMGSDGGCRCGMAVLGSRRSA